METKPYSLQSPEQIAKDYGGNKQKIAEAMQMGIIDPTAGTLAAMFIDRMRNAAQQEAAPQQTVAQQVFAPPAPPMPMAMPQGVPAGLGATPQAAAMAAPAAGMPTPMGPGMAMGGMVPPYMAGGGLSELPVPDGMFDEPSNGGYAGGGLVAFQTGGEVEDEEDMIVVQGQPDNSPESYYGYFRDPSLMREQIDALYTPDRKYAGELSKFYENIRSPEEQKKRRQEDMWLALGQIGARMASTPGSLLQAASAGIGEALPGIAASAKERRAEQRDAIAALAQQEGLNNKEALDLAKLTMEGTNRYGEFDVKRLDREQQERLTKYQEEMANKRTQMQVGAQIQSAKIGARAQEAFADKQLLQLQRQVAAAAVAELLQLRVLPNNPIGQANNAYQMALKRHGAGSAQAKNAYDNLQRLEDTYVQTAVQRAQGGMSATGESTGNRVLNYSDIMGGGR